MNVRAVYFTIAAFLPLLEAGNQKANVAQSSQAIITSSIGAFNRVPMAHFAYGASKAAVLHMAKQLATAFVKYHIRFNVIAPGRTFLSCLFWADFLFVYFLFHFSPFLLFLLMAVRLCEQPIEMLMQPRSVSLRDDWLHRGPRK